MSVLEKPDMASGTGAKRILKLLAFVSAAFLMFYLAKQQIDQAAELKLAREHLQNIDKNLDELTSEPEQSPRQPESPYNDVDLIYEGDTVQAVHTPTGLTYEADTPEAAITGLEEYVKEKQDDIEDVDDVEIDSSDGDDGDSDDDDADTPVQKAETDSSGDDDGE